MIKVPTLLLDEEKCRLNIRVMAEKARNNDVVFRPHFKTHASHEIGRWFREEGVEKITVSSLRMAQYFAVDGWKDILVAFPVNLLETDLINELASDIDLTLLVESPEVVLMLSEKVKSKLSVYIKIDSGLKRTGIPFEDRNAVNEILHEIKKSSILSFRGFLTHAGHSYKARSREEIVRIHNETIAGMAELKYQFRNEFPGLIVSVGDTPTCSVMDDFSMADEIRPGNFVFYDLMQMVIGSCSTDQVAVAMACPVVAVHRERSEIVIYGGSVHFSAESMITASGMTVYGAVVGNEGKGWSGVIRDAYLTRLSQEHGIVSMPPDIIGNYRVGDIIKILPVYSCLTANQMKEYLTTEGRRITRF
jgi:D-serine deaminase-like pyridoxal phosphate-dependent protein